MLFKIILGSDSKLSKNTTDSLHKLFSQLSNRTDTRTSVFIYSKDGTKYGNMDIINHYLASHNLDLYLGTTNQSKAYEISNEIHHLTQILGLNLQLQLGDFAGVRSSNKEAADLSSLSKYPFTLFHSKKTIQFGDEENRIKRKKFEKAVIEYPHYMAGNSYENHPMLIQWIKKLPANRELYEHRIKGGEWNTDVGSKFKEFTKMATVLSAFARDKKNEEEEREKLEKLSEFVSTNPLQIVPANHAIMQQSVRLFNKSPKMVLDTLTMDNKLNLIDVSTNKLEDVNQVFKGKQHIRKKTVRKIPISDFVESEKFKNEIESICGKNDLEYTPFLDL